MLQTDDKSSQHTPGPAKAGLRWLSGLRGWQSRLRASAIGLQGHLDVALPDRIEGWAAARNGPAGRRSVDLLVDGRSIARVRSEAYRDDLKRAGFGDGRHAFRHRIHPPLAEGEHVVRALDAETGIELANSPQRITVRGGLRFDSPYQAYVDWQCYVRDRVANGRSDLQALAAILRALQQIPDFAAIVEIYDFLRRRDLLPITPSDQEHGAFILELAAHAKARWAQAEEAIRILEQAVVMFPAYLPLRRTLAFLLRADDPQRAYELLARVEDTSSFQADSSFLVVMADIAAQLHDPARVGADIRRSFPDNVPLELLLQLANLEPETEGKVACLNEYLQRQGLAPVSLRGAGGAFLDRLTTHEKHFTPDGPLVSVLMTCHNAERHLETSVPSILNQTYRNLELLVVDDASTDNSVALLRRFAELDARVRLITSSTNAGTYAAKNRALAIASGVLVTCHDSDDWAHPRKLECQVGPLADDDYLVANWSCWARVDDLGRFTMQSSGQFAHINPASLMFRRDAVLGAVGYFDSVRAGADSEFRQRLACKFGASAIAGLGETLALGRQHESSLTRSGPSAFDGVGHPPARRAYSSSWLDWHHEQLHGQGDFMMAQHGTQRRFPAPAAIMPGHTGAASDPGPPALRRLYGISAPSS